MKWEEADVKELLFHLKAVFHFFECQLLERYIHIIG